MLIPARVERQTSALSSLRLTAAENMCTTACRPRQERRFLSVTLFCLSITPRFAHHTCARKCGHKHSCWNREGIRIIQEEAEEKKRCVVFFLLMQLKWKTKIKCFFLVVFWHFCQRVKCLLNLICLNICADMSLIQSDVLKLFHCRTSVNESLDTDCR